TSILCSFFFQAEDGIRDYKVTGVQTCALPIWKVHRSRRDARWLEFSVLWANERFLDPGQADLAYRSRAARRALCPLNRAAQARRDRKSTRLNSSHLVISYAVFCLKKKIK